MKADSVDQVATTVYGLLFLSETHYGDLVFFHRDRIHSYMWCYRGGISQCEVGEGEVKGACNKTNASQDLRV